MPRKSAYSQSSPQVLVHGPPPPSSRATKQYDIRPPQPEHPGPSFLGSVIQGMGLGAGSSLGHRMTDAILGPPSRPVDRSLPVTISTSSTGNPGDPNCDDIWERCRQCMSQDTFACDSIYDEYFKCIQPFMSHAQTK
jgi:hypothetical protein